MTRATTTVLVVGATGVLGRALTARLARDADCRVIGTTRGAASDGMERLDLDDAGAIAALVARTQPHFVLHLAATFGDDFESAYGINVKAAHALLEAVTRCNSAPRVVLLGSAAEYGAVRPEDNPVREDHALAPVSVYGLTKAWQSMLAPWFAARGVDVVVARVFNLDGPGFSDRLFVGRVQRQIAELRRGEREAIEVGALGATRDYVAVDDAVEQILAIARHGRRGETYHVASGIPVTMREVLLRHLERAGLDASVVRSSPELSTRRGVDVPVIYADVSRTACLAPWGARG